MIEFIDHAALKHGKKVKFLTFREAHDRLQKALFREDQWRACSDNVILLDVNNDGYLDIVDLRAGHGKTYLWDPEYSHWRVVPGPARLGFNTLLGGGFHFGVLQKNGYASVAHYQRVPRAIAEDRYTEGLYHFDGKKWIADPKVGAGGTSTAVPVYRLLDLDGDGICEKLDGKAGVFAYQPGKDWQRLPFGRPGYDKASPTANVRFLDLNGDGKLDIVHANDKEWGVHVFRDMKTGWTTARAGKAGDAAALPPIARGGTNNGFFIHSGTLWWANEDTHLLKYHVDRRTFQEVLDGK